MKRILLSAVMLSSIGLNAQQELPVKTEHAVGIETTEPRATLDVNGNVRVRALEPENNPQKVVTVDGNNVLKVATLQTSGSSGSIGSRYVGSVGKVYNCNKKNDRVVIYFTRGAAMCIANPSYNTGTWMYNGELLSERRGVGLYRDGVGEFLRSSFTSGLTYALIDRDGRDESVHGYITPPLHVIDDSRYKK